MDESSEKSKPKVLIYKSTLLPISETFIREQCINLSEWKPILVGKILVENGLDLTGLEICLLSRSLYSRVMRRIRLLMQWPLKIDIELLKKENAQLVHAHFGTESVSAWPLAKALGLPMLVTLHGFDINVYREWWESGNAGLWSKSYPSQLLSLAKERDVHFIAVSEAIKKRAVEYGIPPEKIDVSYIGVDTQKFIPGTKPLAERREILFVGRLVEKKGCRYLLEAFLGIQDQFPEYDLVIVGDGPLENELKKYAHNNGVRARFLGAQTSEQVRERMTEARVFCLPSITSENGDAEGLPISILEAQSCGVPVVTSARGGAAEGIVHGVTGFSHSEKDVSGIKDALEHLLGNDQTADKFGEAARQKTLERMDISDCTQVLEKIYSSFAHKYISE
jgi:glycosyltransferase involved in cell wall biosynthesis